MTLVPPAILHKRTHRLRHCEIPLYKAGFMQYNMKYWYNIPAQDRQTFFKVAHLASGGRWKTRGNAF